MRLHTYQVDLVLEEPATLGIESETAFRRDVYRYVPGIVLRGALAAVWIGRFGTPNGSQRTPFRELFEIGLRPGPLLPDTGSLRPLSVTRCKRPPDRAHAHDSLRDQAFDEERSACPLPGCGGPVEAGRGEVEFSSGDDPLVTVTHVPHKRDGVAADAGLHARHYLRPGTRFSGRLSAPPDEFLEGYVGGGEIWLGGRRTVAGRATLTLTRKQPEPLADLAASTPVALRLESPGVFVDRAGRPSSDPLPDLADTLGLPADRIEVQRPWWRPVTVRGWHAATGLPKPTDHAVAAGSTWLLRFHDAVRGDHLTNLATEGLGLRRTEGFGRVTLDRERWRPTAPPVEPDSPPDRAMAHARELWRHVASAPSDQRALADLLRSLAGAAPSEWAARTGAWWRTPTGAGLERTGIAPALAALADAGEPELVRDVRLVLVAAGDRPIPHWLGRALDPEPDRDGGTT